MKSSGNPPVKSKGDYHGIPRHPAKHSVAPMTPPKNPPVREVPYGGRDRVK